MRRKPTLFAVVLGASALIAFSFVTLQPESASSGDIPMTTSTAPIVMANWPSPEEAMASVAYVSAVKAAEDQAYIEALAAKAQSERDAAAAKARAVKAKAAEQAPSTSPTYSPGGYGKWTPIVQCESGGNWSMNSGNGFTGGLQFMTSTWLAQGGGKYAPAAYLATPSQQIEIAERTLASGGWGQWPACSRKAGYR